MLLAAAGAGGLGAGVAGPARAAASDKFPVLEFRVLHNSVLSTRQVESAVYPHLGPDRTLSDVQAARADLEKAYRTAGYSTVYVDVPEQSVEDGIVRLQVTEGRLERVHVTGTRYFINRRIVASLPSLQPGAVPHFPDLQEQLTELNRDSPDLHVVPVLKPGAAPGTVDVDLKVNDTLPLHGSVELNNRYTAGTAPDRVVVNLAYGNLFQRYQTLALQYQTAPQESKDARVLAATYTAPFAGGGSLSAFAVKTDSDVASVGTLAVIGKGEVYGTRFLVPLSLVPGGWAPSLTLGLDYKHFDENVLLASSPALQTPITYLNWSAAFGALSSTPNHLTSVNLGLNFGIRGLVNDPAEFENKRFLARPNYAYLHLDATQEQSLPFGTRIALRLSGQAAAEPLVDNEQFAIGGVESVRGYLEAEALGDKGLSGSLELRTMQLAPLVGATARYAYAYLFYDDGLVRTLDPLPQQQGRTELRSYGAGLRLAGLYGLDGELDWARVRIAAANAPLGDSRFQFFVRYGF